MTDHELMNEIRDRDHEEFEETCRFEQAEEEAKEAHRSRLCKCGSEDLSRPLYDGHGIYLCDVCDQCLDQKLSKYRPDIMTAYDTDEAI